MGKWFAKTPGAALVSVGLLMNLTGASWAELVDVKKSDVEVKSLLVKGQDNIVVFHHKPTYLSHQLYNSLVGFSKKNPGLPIFVVEVPNNKSPLVKKYAIRNFPHVQIYGKDGTLKEEGAPAYQTVTSMLDR